MVYTFVIFLFCIYSLTNAFVPFHHATTTSSISRLFMSDEEKLAVQVTGEELEVMLQEWDQPLVVGELAVGDPGLVEVLPLAPDHDARLRLRVGQGREQDRADDREDGRGRSDPERERQNRRRRESRRLSHGAERVTDILKELRHHTSSFGARAPAHETAAL